MSGDSCNHRDLTIHQFQEGAAGEWHVYAECDVCGQKKSALVDFHRDYANCGPVSEGEWNTNVGGE